MTNATATPKVETIDVAVPEGLTPAQYKKLLESFGKQAATAIAKAESDKTAYKAFMEAHKDEWKDLRNKERKSRGLPLVGEKAS